jgi:decaprenylphospho-beta-D-ribofuranose 2-oxidase
MLEPPQSEAIAREETGLATLNGSVLPAERLERVGAWGEASSALGYVYRPATVEGLAEVFDLARRTGRSVGIRGSGNSYGDATLNAGNIILDMQRMNRILAYDPEEAAIQVEPGVTVAQLWQYVIQDGWWPVIVPGTSKPTIGGCASMNIHGKNAWKVGTIGDHIRSFELMLPGGEILKCSRDENRDLFFSAIGGFGMLGAFTSLTLALKRVYSGMLQVEAYASLNLQEMMAQFEEHLPTSDYLVGWIDAFAGGKSLGRGQIHKATYLPPGADPYPQFSLRLDNQHLDDTMFAVVPRSIMWRLMRPFMNNLGTRLVNTAKYRASRLSHGSVFRQSHVAFHFLLDYVPNWKRAYGRGGLVQYQSFVAADVALETFSRMLELCQRRRLPNFLTVLKRHRPDDFLISHGLDGYSMAMDFRVTNKNRARLASLARELDELVLAAGGRFYLAKDSTLSPEAVRRYLGAETVESFRALKKRVDPETLLQTNLWRRLFEG